MADRTLQFIVTGRDAGGGSMLTSMGVKAESVVGKIGGSFSKLGNQIGGEFGNILSQAGQGIQDFGEKGKNAGAKLAVAGVGMAGLGVALSNVGSSEKQASDQLKAAIEASGNSLSDYQGQIEDAVKHQENFGHSAVDTKNALAKLTEATGSPEKALREMGVVADLAAAKHISLADASQLVARVLGGSGGKVLAQYGVTMGKNADGTKNVDKAVSDLAAKLQGQASASVNNFAGKVDVARTKLGDWVAQMGQKFGPALTVAGVGVTALGTAVQVLQTRSAAAAVSEAALTTATTAEGTAAAGATVATAGFGASVLGVVGPIGLATAGAYALKTAAHAMGVDVSLGTDQMLAATKGAKGFNQFVAKAADTVGGEFVAAMKLGTAASRAEAVQTAATTAANTVFGGAMANSGLKAKDLGAAITGTRPAYDKFIANLITSQQQAGYSNTVIRSNVSVLGSLRNSYLAAGGGAATQAAQVRGLNADIHALPVSKATKIKADTLAARGDVAALQKLLDALHGSTVKVTVVYDATGTARYVGGPAVGGHLAAAGGLISGPGGPTDDRVPVWASAGEYMMKAAAVAKYGTNFMNMVNAQKLAAGGPIVLQLPSSNALSATFRTALGKAVPPGIVGGAVAAPGNISALQAYAASLFPLYGWGAGQLGPLISLWNLESGWNPAAYNPNGGASGIPQALPGSKMASAGADWRTNGATQIRWGEGYIHDVYGTPANAWAFEMSHSPPWYGKGLSPTVFNRPTLIGVGDGGPETVSVTPGRGGAGAVHVTVNVTGSVVSEQQLQQSVLAGLDRARRRRGRGSLLDA